MSLMDHERSGSASKRAEPAAGFEMVDLTKMVEPAGRYASCLRSPLLSSVGPSTFQLDADHSSLSGLRGDRLFPAVAAAPGSRALTGSAPRILAGSISGPEDRPRSHRPAIPKTMPDDLTEPAKTGTPLWFSAGTAISQNNSAAYARLQIW